MQKRPFTSQKEKLSLCVCVSKCVLSCYLFLFYLSYEFGDLGCEAGLVRCAGSLLPMWILLLCGSKFNTTSHYQSCMHVYQTICTVLA